MSNDFWLWASGIAVGLLGVTLLWLALRPRILTWVCVEVATLVGIWALLSSAFRILANSDGIGTSTALSLSGGVGLGIVPALWLSIYIGRRRA